MGVDLLRRVSERERDREKSSFLTNVSLVFGQVGQIYTGVMSDLFTYLGADK